jgi:hypothetical protein
LEPSLGAARQGAAESAKRGAFLIRDRNDVRDQLTHFRMNGQG